MTQELLTIDYFRVRLGEAFGLSSGETALDLVLREVEDLGQGPERRAFSLLFSAPSRPVMPQAIYRLENAATGPLDIFLVPLGPQKGVFCYQAIFT